MAETQAAIDVLRQTRALIEDEKRWTHGSWARTEPEDYADLDADDPRAKCWCLGGAMYLVSGDPGITEAERPYDDPALAAWRALERAMHSTSVIAWNDSHTHSEVLAAVDRAIAFLQAAA